MASSRDQKSVELLQVSTKINELKLKANAYRALHDAFAMAGDQQECEKHRQQLHVLLDAELDLSSDYNRRLREYMLNPPDC